MEYYDEVVEIKDKSNDENKDFNQDSPVMNGPSQSFRKLEVKMLFFSA